MIHKVNSQLFVRIGKDVDNHKHNDEYTCVEALLASRPRTNIRPWKSAGVSWLPTDTELMEVNKKLAEESETFKENLKSFVNSFDISQVTSSSQKKREERIKI